MISFVIPLFNEEESLVPLHEALSKAAAALPHKYEILFVDDGSTDRSPMVLKELYKHDPGHVRVPGALGRQPHGPYIKGFTVRLERAEFEKLLKP